VAPLQSWKPALHVYEQLTPLQLSADAWSSTQATPQPLQLLVVLVGVEQPPRLGAPVEQSAHPVAQV
jgi:hypothetical protein